MLRDRLKELQPKTLQEFLGNEKQQESTAKLLAALDAQVSELKSKFDSDLANLRSEIESGVRKIMPLKLQKTDRN